MATDRASLPPPPAGCVWVELRYWADAIGRPRDTANSWAFRGQLDGKEKPLGVKRGERWFVAARIVGLPEKRPVPVPDLPERDPLSEDALLDQLMERLVRRLGGK